MKFIKTLLFCLIIHDVSGQPTPKLSVVSSPSGSQYTRIDKSGKSIIPNGRIITPYGKSVEVAPHPYGLTLSPDGTVAVTANSGTAPISISIIKNLSSENPTVLQIPPGASTDKGILASVFMGLAISPDNKIVYVSGGQANRIYLFSVDSGAKLDSIDCSVGSSGEKTRDGYIGELKLTKDTCAKSFSITIRTTNFSSRKVFRCRGCIRMKRPSASS